MTKFIITGDLHFRVANPLSRLDNYAETCMAKLDEVFDIARRNYVAAIIIPGDIFDSPNCSLGGLAWLASHLKKAPCPIITVPGNHDSFSHNLATIDRTPYGVLRRLDYIKCVDSTHSTFGGMTDMQPWVATGHGYDADTDIDLSQYAVPNDIHFVEENPFRIHVTHGMLLKDAPYEGIRHTLISDLANIPEEDRPHVLVNGHYHLGLPLSWVGKTLVINPGALLRGTAHVAEIGRMPQVALLTVKSTTDYNAEFIPLKSAKPGAEVLSREHIEVEKARDERLDTFLRLLNSDGGEDKYLDIQDIIDGIVSKDSVSKEVRNDALKRIGEAHERIGGREQNG